MAISQFERSDAYGRRKKDEKLAELNGIESLIHSVLLWVVVW